jgi:hypothetical protein
VTPEVGGGDSRSRAGSTCERGRYVRSSCLIRTGVEELTYVAKREVRGIALQRGRSTFMTALGGRSRWRPPHDSGRAAAAPIPVAPLRASSLSTAATANTPPSPPVSRCQHRARQHRRRRTTPATAPLDIRFLICIAFGVNELRHSASKFGSPLIGVRMTRRFAVCAGLIATTVG